MDKLEWLTKLFYDIGKQKNDFYLSGMTKDSDGNIRSTKWRKFSEAVFPLDAGDAWKLNRINQRQILPNEVVLDLEERGSIDWVVDTLKSWRVIFKVFDTGSRGFHVSAFFNRDLTPEEKIAVIRYFGADEQKAGKKTMIALEYCPHWKSGKIKEEVGYA